ncbi:MAG TPA: hypothetical protein VGA00_02245 [Acidiferrobacterales bacterium]|jgi:hypothetical protein
MLYLSEILLQHHDIDSFERLLDVVSQRAQQGEMFFKIDIKPPYPDTPNNWEDRLEGAFVGIHSITTPGRSR